MPSILLAAFASACIGIDDKVYAILRCLASGFLLLKLKNLILPALTLGIRPLAIVVSLTRSSLLDVLSQDYIRTARAKGLPSGMVIYKHALRNALLPFITMFGLMLPGLIGGSVIFETIFAWPGMGRLGYEAILSRDFPVILTLNFISAVLVLIGTFISDILYAAADPRIKLY